MGELVKDPVFKEESTQINQNWKVLEAYLQLNGHHLDLLQAPRQFAVGFGNINYYIRFDGVPAVLRRPPMGLITPGSNDMLREAKILKALEPHFSLAPKCLFVGSDTNIWGVPFFIMEFRPGVIIHSSIPSYINDKIAVAKTLTAELINILTSLHAIEPNRIGLEKLGRSGDYFARTVRGWCKRAEIAWGPELPKEVLQIKSWLEKQVPEEQTPVLLHNDFKLDNIIFDPTSFKPTALIDWDLGTRGDALWDLAVLLSYWAEPNDPDSMRTLRQMPTLEPGFPSRETVIQTYAEETGRNISNINMYRVLAQFRLAVVFRQIFRRYRDSEEVNERASAFDELSIGLLNFACDISRGDFH